MRHQIEAKAAGQSLHQGGMVLILKFDHMTGVDIDKMVMMLMAGLAGLITRTTTTEITTLQNAFFLEQANCAVDCGDGNPRIELGGASVQFLDVRMIFSLGQDARNDTALPCHLEAPVDT